MKAFEMWDGDTAPFAKAGTRRKFTGEKDDIDTWPARRTRRAQKQFDDAVEQHSDATVEPTRSGTLGNTPLNKPYQAQTLYRMASGQPPPQPPRRTGTDADLLPQGQERAEQIETLQSLEANRPQSEDEKNQEILQREFPKIDSSLIAAIYGDSNSLSATREMLQELSSE
ncbi:hypothetical protein BS50DRAFT_640997 [Corynespora cassiicola Philippines]|uniref:Uncharacterized protein n=1 Tax=Corynespora cassiicola Philippines TaxID=1448308 RepID=A0A2T2N255_CORCC|nr:hypothetical protein BS50DRAFT_640997 [Corynespora cassiicola Philippines]